MLMNLLTQIFIGSLKPLKGRRENRFEFFNDISVYLVTYHFMFFSDFIPEQETQFQIGWSCIIFTLLCIAINMVPIIKELINTIVLFLKFMYNRIIRKF